MVQRERIWILLGKRQCGEASGDELKELSALLKEDESARLSEDIIDKLWKVPIKTMDTSQNNQDWPRLAARIEKEGKKMPFKWWLSAAAVIAVLVVATFFLKQEQKHQQIATENTIALRQNNIATPVHARSKIELPDGSIVWINSNSRLTYDSKDFGIHNREVSLQGEAYFEVKKNAGLPFIVHVQQADIKVLGTAFNVKTYGKDKNIEVALIRGKVAVSLLNEQRKEVILKPDEKIIIPKQLPEIKKINGIRPFKILKIERDKAGQAEVTAWTREKLVFDNDTFEQIAGQMEKWYQIKIRFANDSLKKLHFSGVVEQETISETLHAMQLSQPFHFQVKDNVVWIGK